MITGGTGFIGAEVARLCPDHRALREELEANDHLYRAF